MKTAFFLLFLVPAFSCFAQQVSVEQKNGIKVIEDSRIDTLLNRYQAMKAEDASIQGYRIQVASGSNRSVVYNIKAKFYSMFPKIKPYVVYQQPNFKLRVGNYRTRLEAYKDLQDITDKFSDAFIIRDEIKLEELLNE